MTHKVLPSDFQDLVELVDDWVHPTELERNQYRVARSMSELQTFYNRVMPRLEDISAYLDHFPLDGLSRDCGNLLELALMVMEVAPAIEYYDNPDVPESVEYEKFKIFPVTAKYSVITNAISAR